MLLSQVKGQGTLIILQTAQVKIQGRYYHTTWKSSLKKLEITLVFSIVDARKIRKHSKNASPKNPKEVKQFLGLVGYYRKFVPMFADISRVLTHLTKKDVEFKWTPECKNCFQILKDFLQKAPILKYPDPPSQLHTVHRCIEICICQCPNTAQQWHRPPHNLCKWFVHRIPVKLGHTYQKSLCNLHVSEKAYLLHQHCKNNS